MFWTPLGAPAATLAQRMRTVMKNAGEAKKADPVPPQGRGIRLFGAVVRDGRNPGARAAAPAGFPAGVERARVERARPLAEPLYLGGARLEALCPVSTLISGMGLNITFMSYAGHVLVGYTANASALPEADRLGRYTADAFRALERQSRATGRRPMQDRRPGPAVRSG